MSDSRDAEVQAAAWDGRTAAWDGQEQGSEQYESPPESSQEPADTGETSRLDQDDPYWPGLDEDDTYIHGSDRLGRLDQYRSSPNRRSDRGWYDGDPELAGLDELPEPLWGLAALAGSGPAEPLDSLHPWPHREPAPWEPIAIDAPSPQITAVPPASHSSFRADTECDGWSTPYATVRMASVRGAQHRHTGKPRQDSALSVADADTGTIMFAVADGFSSATAAEQGASAVCNSAVFAIHKQLVARYASDGRRTSWHDADSYGVDWPSVVDRTAEALYSRAIRRLGVAEPELNQVEELFATALITGIAHCQPDGLEIELCRVGNSGAWILDMANGRYYPVFSPPAAPTEVAPPDDTGLGDLSAALPRVPEYLEQAAFLLGPESVLLVGTDGFGDPLGDGTGRVGALFARHLAVAPPPVWLAHLLDFYQEGFDDDRTLLVIWPRRPNADRFAQAEGAEAGNYVSEQQT